jgi:cell fate (sporulation/competence/biofilm development) regulator YlbF (YheA/YmcA/DUF963 family)
MKKTITILLLVIISTSAFSQKKDSIKINQPTDSTALLTVSDLKTFDLKLQGMFTISELQKYQSIIEELNKIVATRIDEWMKKNNNPKK